MYTRWQVDDNGKPVRHPDDGRKVLQFVAIMKQGQWAIPGGRVIEGEKLVDTLEREFSEEALGKYLSCSLIDKLMSHDLTLL